MTYNIMAEYNIMMAGASFKDICSNELHWDGAYITQEPRGGVWNGVTQEVIIKWMPLDSSKELYILELSLFDAGQEHTPWYKLAEKFEQRFYFNREKISIKRFTRWGIDTVSEITGVIVSRVELQSIFDAFKFSFSID